MSGVIYVIGLIFPFFAELRGDQIASLMPFGIKNYTSKYLWCQMASMVFDNSEMVFGKGIWAWNGLVKN
jgi:hypothetical protein